MRNPKGWGSQRLFKNGRSKRDFMLLALWYTLWILPDLYHVYNTQMLCVNKQMGPHFTSKLTLRAETKKNKRSPKAEVIIRTLASREITELIGGP